MSTSRQARRIAMSDGHFRRGRRERDTRLIAPNTLEANRRGRLPYIPGHCERRPLVKDWRRVKSSTLPAGSPALRMLAIAQDDLRPANIVETRMAIDRLR